MAKNILTERDIVNAAKQGKKSIFADTNTVITPAAKDKARELKVQFTDTREAPDQSRHTNAAESYATATISSMNVGSNLIVIGSDHGGFQTKEMLKKYLADLGTGCWMLVQIQKKHAIIRIMPTRLLASLRRGKRGVAL